MSESNWKDNGYNPSEHGWWRATLDGRADLGYPTGYYYADTIRAIMIAFTKFFNDLYVIRYDENGFPRKRIRVPIKFGPRSKAHDFRKEQESGETYYIPLPNMYYKIINFQYDNTRSASSNAIRTFYEEYLMSKGIEESQAQLLWEDTQPVPYNLSFELSAKTEKIADLFQIVEQISSRFNPDAFLYIKEFWFMNIRRDIKMKLDTIALDYQDEFGEQDKRELEAKFTFTIEGQVYTKIQEGAIIDQIITRLNPSIATYKTEDVTLTLRGLNATDKEFYISDTEDNWLIKNKMVVRDRDSQYDGIGVYVPSSGAYDSFSYWKMPERYDLFGNKKDPENPEYYWQFTSAITSDVADKYTSIIGLSGNYMPVSGSYDPSTGKYMGSIEDRYDFARITEDDYTSSGRKDFVNSENDVIDTQWVSNHEIEIR